MIKMKYLIGLGFGCLLSMPCFGDVLETVDGRKMEGKVISQNDGNVTFDAHRFGAVVRIVIPEKEIASITNGEMSAATSKPTAAKVTSSTPLPWTRPPTTTPTGRAEMIEHVRNAVLQVRSKDQGGVTGKVGSAFLVLDGGFAITNFHVIEGSVTATVASDANAKEETAVELWIAKPEFDLAVIKLKSGVGGQGILLGLNISPNEPRQGEDVIALGFPLDMPYTVTRGIVSAIRPIGSLTTEQQAWMKQQGRSNECRWIQTDCPINSGNSGGPLINEKGELVGVTTWIDLAGVDGQRHNSMFFALSAMHVSDLLKHLGNTPIGFDGAKKLYKGQQISDSGLPQIFIPRNESSSEVSARAAAIQNTGICRICKGTGMVIKRVRVSGGGNGGLQRPDMRNSSEVCSECRGGLLNKVAIGSLMPAFADAVSKVKPDDPDGRNRFRVAGDVVWGAYKLNARLFCQAIGNSVVKSSRKEDVASGSPLVGVGTMLKDGREPIQGFRHQWIIVEDRLVLLTNPVMCEAELDGEVVFGGRFAGFMNTKSGQAIIVLQNGFLINRQ